MEEKFTPDPKDVEDNKVMAILAYLGILVLVPILAAKDSPFARFHANQGLILCVVAVVFLIVISILSAIFVFIAPFLGILFGLINGAVGLGFFAFMIIGIMNAVQGKMAELPLIGKYRIIK